MGLLGRRIQVATGQGRSVEVPVVLLPLAAIALCCSCYTACAMTNGALLGASIGLWPEGPSTEVATTVWPRVSPASTDPASPAATSVVEPTATQAQSSVQTPLPNAGSGSPTLEADPAAPTETPAYTATRSAPPTPARPTPTFTPTASPVPTPTAIVTATATPTLTVPISTATPTLTPTTALSPTRAVSLPNVHIVKVDRIREFVNIRNDGGMPQDLEGWVLVSERGGEACPLAGVLNPGATMRIWALADDVGQDGYNCGFGVPIWEDEEQDAAILYDQNGQRVDKQ